MTSGGRKVIALSQRKLTFPVRAAKTLAVAGKRGDSNFVCTCLQAQSMTELNQKLTKHSQEMFNTGCLHGGKIPMQELGGERGGRAFAQRGHIFGNLLYMCKCNSSVGRGVGSGPHREEYHYIYT